MTRRNKSRDTSGGQKWADGNRDRRGASRRKSGSDNKPIGTLRRNRGVDGRFNAPSDGTPAAATSVYLHWVPN